MINDLVENKSVRTLIHFIVVDKEVALLHSLDEEYLINNATSHLLISCKESLSKKSITTINRLAKKISQTTDGEKILSKILKHKKSQLVWFEQSEIDIKVENELKELELQIDKDIENNKMHEAISKFQHSPIWN